MLSDLDAAVSIRRNCSIRRIRHSQINSTVDYDILLRFRSRTILLVPQAMTKLIWIRSLIVQPAAAATAALRLARHWIPTSAYRSDLLCLRRNATCAGPIASTPPFRRNTSVGCMRVSCSTEAMLINHAAIITNVNTSRRNIRAHSTWSTS